MIATGMFSGCKKLQNITIRNVKEIDSYAFLDCKKLINIDAPKIEKSHSNAFFNSDIDTSVFDKFI